jgi:hypothetical protein
VRLPTESQIRDWEIAARRDPRHAALHLEDACNALREARQALARLKLQAGRAEAVLKRCRCRDGAGEQLDAPTGGLPPEA